MKTIGLLSVVTITAACLLPATAAAQTGRGLLFTTQRGETSSQCLLPGSAISHVLPEEVQYVVPTAASAYTSLAYATQDGHGELLGDIDADGDYWESQLFGHIDALLRPQEPSGAFPPLHQHSLFFSARWAVGPPAAPLTDPGDVFRVLPGGGLEFFLTATQVRSALGMSVATAIDIDAVAFDPYRQGIFLSLEANHMVDLVGGVVMAHDGAILRIPLSALTLTVSPFDGAALVDRVLPRSGVLVYSEANVDVMCSNSGVADDSGQPVRAVRDVSGLTWDEPTGQLWFCGEGLLGGSVLTTVAAGQIASLNGVPLGQLAPTPTTGTQVGLLPMVRSLNALSLVGADLVAFAADTPTPIPNGGNVRVEAAGVPPNYPVWLLLNLLPDAPGGPPDPSSAWPNPGFPRLYAFLSHIGPMGAGPTGCVDYAGGPVPLLPGWHVTVQALSYAPTGSLMLSTPVVLDM